MRRLLLAGEVQPGCTNGCDRVQCRKGSVGEKRRYTGAPPGRLPPPIQGWATMARHLRVVWPGHSYVSGQDRVSF
jgi:hypothetical protein